MNILNIFTPKLNLQKLAKTHNKTRKIFEDEVRERQRIIKSNFRMKGGVKNPYYEACRLSTRRINDENITTN